MLNPSPTKKSSPHRITNPVTSQIRRQLSPRSPSIGCQPNSAEATQHHSKAFMSYAPRPPPPIYLAIASVEENARPQLDSTRSYKYDSYTNWATVPGEGLINKKDNSFSWGKPPTSA